eukprot:10183858-Ditylum_brightwellii.AAC.1
MKNPSSTISVDDKREKDKVSNSNTMLTTPINNDHKNDGAEKGNVMSTPTPNHYNTNPSSPSSSSHQTP